MEVFEGGSNLIIYFKDVIKLDNMKRKNRDFMENSFIFNYNISV